MPPPPFTEGWADDSSAALRQQSGGVDEPWGQWRQGLRLSVTSVPAAPHAGQRSERRRHRVDRRLMTHGTHLLHHGGQELARRQAHRGAHALPQSGRDAQAGRLVPRGHHRRRGQPSLQRQNCYQATRQAPATGTPKRAQAPAPGGGAASRGPPNVLGSQTA